MMRPHLFFNLLAVLLLVAPAMAVVCPNSCVCSTTGGLHRATCSSLTELYKFTLRQKHHNINILDLSHNNITKLSHELDRLTEVVMLDLSTNGIQTLNKFFHNAKKLVHLNLANNRIQHLSLTHLPTSVSSLDLTNNLLQDVPQDLGHLYGLEHLDLEGNPLDCSCANLLARDRLLADQVIIDIVKCAMPPKLKGRSWLELKTKDICKTPKIENSINDMMMGDQPLGLDPIGVGKDSSSLKSMSLVAGNGLNEGKVLEAYKNDKDDISEFIPLTNPVTIATPSSHDEGSGAGETTDIPYENVEGIKEDPLEGSGEGSGSGFGPLIFPTSVTRFHDDTDKKDTSSTEFPVPEMPGVFNVGILSTTEKNIQSTEKPATSPIPRDTTISEQIRVTSVSEVQGAATTDAQPVHKTGTYVCIAIIVTLLVGLIGFAIIKGQMRKRRDRRLLRQQKRDVEKASKEMVDMNKSLLGKPAQFEHPDDKKVNGKYELVPTHEMQPKKNENGNVTNGIKYDDNEGTRTDSPRDTNQNKSSSRDNNLAEDDDTPLQETSFESAPASPDSRKDTHSLSSEDIFVPVNDDDTPRLNGTGDSDISQPLINGDQNTDSDFLSPSREYVPVYSPDMGRVRIKMTETPKPKTPVLVTRSRSNAGDIIITPSGDVNSRKSTT